MKCFYYPFFANYISNCPYYFPLAGKKVWKFVYGQNVSHKLFSDSSHIRKKQFADELRDTPYIQNCWSVLQLAN